MSLVLGFSPGTGRGEVASWTWSRTTSVQFVPFTATTGPVHIETFDSEWHSPNPDPRANNEPFVGALVVPTTAIPALFGAGFPHEPPTAIETFERHWHLPKAPPASRTILGNEEAILSWSDGVEALFAGGDAFEGFEHGWSTNEAFVWAFTAPMLTAAPVDDFESWGALVLTFTAGSVASFSEGAGTQSFEDFSQVAPDLPVTFTLPSTISAPTPPGFLAGQLLSFYNGGGGGALPPEIDSRRTYYLVLLSGTDFEIATSSSGSALIFSAASGNNFVKSDPRFFWTLTDVGI